MKYSLRVSEQKNRKNFFLFEPVLNVVKFFTGNSISVKDKNLLYFYFFKNKNIFRTSLSFIHNRCVVTYRHVRCFDCLKCLVIKLNS